MNANRALPLSVVASILLAFLFAGLRAAPALAVNLPVPVNDAYVAVQGVQLDIAAPGLLANDSGPAVYQLSVVLPLGSGPYHGQLIAFGGDGSLSYLPDAGYFGSDTLTYEIHATGQGGDLVGATLGNVTFTVQASANLPIGVDDAYSTAMDTPLDIDATAGVLANDSDLDGDPLTAESPSLALHGSLTLNTDGSFHYEPDAGFVGDDLFNYWAYSAGESSPAITTVTITVTAGPAPANNPPINADDFFVTSQDTQLMVDLANSVLLNDSDPDGDALIVPTLTQPAHGSLWLYADGTFTYEPNIGFVGTDTFTYSAFDGVDFAATPATVSINVLSSAPNNPPVGGNDFYFTSENTPLDVDAANGVLLNDSDPDGNQISVAYALTPTFGTVTVNPDGSFHYEPPAGFLGTASFLYAVSDGKAASFVLPYVKITVGGGASKHLPIGIDDAYTTPQDTMLTVAAASSILDNDSDQDGDALQANLVLGPMHANSFTLNPDGTFSYEPLPGFVGSDSFHYVVSDVDGNALSSTLVTIAVTPTDDPGPTEDPGSDVTPEPTEPVITPADGGPDVTPDGSSADPTPTEGLLITTLPNTGSGSDQNSDHYLAILALLAASLVATGFGFRTRRTRG